MASPEIDTRIGALAESIEKLVRDVQQDEGSRTKLLGAIEEAQRNLETPIDVIWKLIMSASTQIQ